MADTKNYVIQLQTALSTEPTYIKTDGESTIDTVIRKAIEKLGSSGKEIEQSQLENLYKTHKLFVGEQEISKGATVKSLPSTPTSVQNTEVELVPVTLVSSHSGGN